MCWSDKCHVTSPTGYATYMDGGHYGRYYARYWLSVLDYTVKF
jgi:hypothetical protein